MKDVSGHGTHVASTIAGTGAASDGKEKGVAPGVRMHDGCRCSATIQRCPLAGAGVSRWRARPVVIRSSSFCRRRARAHRD
ncbi:S8 family serine peptidase [Micromonospora sp. NPDC023737]|uniref:S8 family serine peptidase n=1 Tax=unclassified Micromonospora TaxID=2617518 RepID=UPI0033EE8BC0